MKNKLALITGSAKRLGRDLALSLANDGYDIIIHYLESEKEAEQLKGDIEKLGRRAFTYSANMKFKNEILKMKDWFEEQFESLDLLINNVGNYPIKKISELSLEEWDDTIQTNLNGAFYMIHSFLPFIKNCEGNIINIGYAGSESIRANTLNTPYAISKTGLLILTKSLAKDLGNQNIRVNMVSPGQLEFSIDLPKNLKKVIPLQRAGTSTDVYQAINYILNSSYITGINIDVAGGHLL
ncbi:MAG: hypothetical protein COA79_01005 [Planctomycetota bacterium]|nr:MAG: hypothetical protein COA79_01005 [Planctomycetota bacterium]